MTNTETQIDEEDRSGIPDGWELVVGLETHVELATRSKLFCGCPNSFGDDPNTNVCPTCLGLPGSLPVLNEKAVSFAMTLGRALHCTVNPSVFSRKNYFYPDMPKDFQTTQYDLPTNSEGFLDLPNGFRVEIERAHIEEDTGKSTHMGGDGRIHSAEYSLVDYNRAGVPLVEIVTKPDIRTAEQAKAYVSELRDILETLGVSDAKMEEGSMRVDANVSIRPPGSTELRTRCEIKNINSIRSLGRAIAYEAQRHAELYANNDAPIQETRHWDEAGGRTRPGRVKEDAEDYRYFPEPDLLPLEPSAEELQAIDDAMPVMPGARRSALLSAGASPEDTALLVDRSQDGFALDAVAAGADAGAAVKHLVNNLADGVGQMEPAALAGVVQMEAAGELSSTQAKTVLAELVTNGGSPADIATAMGFEAMDTGELDGLLDQLIADNPDQWARFVDGDKKVQGFFVGQIMKATQGQADGKVVNQLMVARAQS